MKWYTLDKNKNVIPYVDYWKGENEKLVPRFASTDEEFGKIQRVDLTKLSNGTRISTVFLSLDHSHVPGGPPIVFETMVFPKDGWADEDCERYSTYAEAVEGHKKMVEKWKNLNPEVESSI
jgi:hypothetical protein